MSSNTKVTGAERIAKAMCVAFWRGKLEPIRAATKTATFEAIVVAAAEMEFKDWELAANYVFNEGQ